MEKMEIDQIKQRLDTSFHPYRCVTEEQDYKDKIRVHILDRNGNSIIHIKRKPIAEIDNESSLSFFIEQLKETIRGKGHPIA